MLPAILLLSVTASLGAPVQAPQPGSPPGTHVWVGDHRLHLHCRGAGSPTVVFESGLGGSSLDWVLVQPAIAKFTRACTYDRGGYAWSDSGPLPRNGANLVGELARLLGNGSVSGPYVLVGHSLGGLLVQQYARENPGQVAALVLVDATHEDQFRRLDEAMHAAGHGPWRNTMALTAVHVPDGLPGNIRALAEAFSTRGPALVAVRSELGYLRRVGRWGRAPGLLPEVPLVVISHRVNSDDSSAGALFEEVWMELQRDLATRTPHSKHLIAATARHYVHVYEPDIVIDAVREIVDQYRSGPRRD